MLKGWLILVMCITMLSACRKDLNDDDKPMAEIVSPTGGTFTDTIPFQLNFTDNKNLFQYRLEISFTGAYDSNDSAVVKPFTLIWVDNISTSADSKLLKIPVGDSIISGSYRAVLSCVDEAGLESIRDTVLFAIQNNGESTLPAINVTAPLLNTTYSDSLNVSAVITDASKVVYYVVELKDSTTATKGQKSKYLNDVSYPVDEVFYTNTLPAGNYTILVTVRDAYYNVATTSIPIILN